MPVFEWNDETIKNSYGFRVRNAGGNFARFDNNSVMLNSHVNTTEMTIGNWKNRIVEGPKLKGETVFDSARDSVKEVEGQVDRGFVKGCSMGLAIGFDDDSWQLGPDGVWDLVKWELMEVSICAVPSLSSALALFNKDTGEKISEDQLKLSIQNLNANDINKVNNLKMEKIILSTAALSALVGVGVSSGDNVADISRGIVDLQAKLTKSEGDKTASDSKVTELQAQLDKQVKLQAETLIDGAIAEGKLTAAERDAYIADAKANFELTSKLIGKIPAKTDLSSKLNNSSSAAGEVKNMDDFEKLSTEKQLAFKNEHPEEYQKLFAR